MTHNKANGKKLNGLVRRREEEQRLYKTPCATVQPVHAARDNTELPTIRRGSKGEAVRKLQQALLDQKFKSCEINGKKKYLAADGDFGAITEKILRRWQSYKHFSICILTEEEQIYVEPTTVAYFVRSRKLSSKVTRTWRMSSGCG